ncbi:23S rRNA (pseudouridine(1915)-N(3))-methyltransferase RlmH [Dehalobacterium formicoaceticum]|uniref:Ribosomal RNA large subunit methyltransferase H n=1 Tax=Dehalobacterium formicoaceticum TaxID=51515 RepID=A0ABT1Y3P4_9FIRM|nr:23S rRNA (pseudouridine(1915)-N(3))-methyltransferase RlmH [Dehalobacterium formicoaceticum]MCR6545492.1 23S rRNA (pseudouridine(1915)-N(3))-methyltransferase RlmH [Dehalobacterium formicoaceticum]
MHIKIIAVGKLKEKYLKEGIHEYLKRLTPHAKVEIIEVSDEKTLENASETEIKLIKDKEGERISRHLKEGIYLIALDVRGKNLSSEELAAKIHNLGVQGKSDLTFLIGGSVGLADFLLEQADFRLSFGRMIYPHQLMRLILLEQLYRCFKINAGHPYHK